MSIARMGRKMSAQSAWIVLRSFKQGNASVKKAL